MRKKILIVAATKDVHDLVFFGLGKKAMGLNAKVAFVSALSAASAADKFATDFAAIVVVADDGGPPVITILPLVRMFRAAGFSGPIIAAGDRDCRRQLMLAGCDREATIHALPNKLIEVLGL